MQLDVNGQPWGAKTMRSGNLEFTFRNASPGNYTMQVNARRGHGSHDGGLRRISSHRMQIAIATGDKRHVDYAADAMHFEVVRRYRLAVIGISIGHDASIATVFDGTVTLKPPLTSTHAFREESVLALIQARIAHTQRSTRLPLRNMWRQTHASRRCAFVWLRSFSLPHAGFGCA